MLTQDPRTHEMEHQRLYDSGRTVTALPTAANYPNGLVSYGGSGWYSDGTRWLSHQLYSLKCTVRPGAVAADNIAANTSGVLWEVHPDNASDIYVTAITTSVFVQTTNSAVSYWQVKVRTRTSTTTDATTSFIANTSAGSPGVLIPLTAFVTSPGGLALPQVITRADFYDLRVDYTKAGATGTPGALFFEPLNVWYRLVGV